MIFLSCIVYDNESRSFLIMLIDVLFHAAIPVLNFHDWSWQNGLWRKKDGWHTGFNWRNRNLLSRLLKPSLRTLYNFLGSFTRFERWISNHTDWYLRYPSYSSRHRWISSSINHITSTIAHISNVKYQAFLNISTTQRKFWNKEL